MTWQVLLAQGRILREPTSRAELRELGSLVGKYLADAQLAGLSDDGKFDRAYGARTLTGGDGRPLRRLSREVRGRFARCHFPRPHCGRRQAIHGLGALLR